MDVVKINNTSENVKKMLDAGGLDSKSYIEKQVFSDYASLLAFKESINTNSIYELIYKPSESFYTSIYVVTLKSEDDRCQYTFGDRLSISEYGLHSPILGETYEVPVATIDDTLYLNHVDSSNNGEIIVNDAIPNRLATLEVSNALHPGGFVLTDSNGNSVTIFANDFTIHFKIPTSSFSIKWEYDSYEGEENLPLDPPVFTLHYYNKTLTQAITELEERISTLKSL